MKRRRRWLGFSARPATCETTRLFVLAAWLLFVGCLSSCPLLDLLKVLEGESADVSCWSSPLLSSALSSALDSNVLMVPSRRCMTTDWSCATMATVSSAVNRTPGSTSFLPVVKASIVWVWMWSSGFGGVSESNVRAVGSSAGRTAVFSPLGSAAILGLVGAEVEV